MALVSNGYRLGMSPFAHGRGALVTIYGGNTGWRNGGLSGRLHNWNLHTDRSVALPYGATHPAAWMLPRTGGGMAMRVQAEGTLAGNLVPTYPMEIDLTGAGDLDATAGLVVSMLLALAGSGSITASITGRLNATLDLTGAGGLSASMQGVASMIVGLLGVGDLDATIAAIGDMSIDIVVTGAGLSTANVGQAVWSALAAANNDAGTMGNKLNGAASAGDPWSTALPGSYASGTAGALLAALQNGLTAGQQAQLLDLWRLAALDEALPQTVARNGNTTTITVGSITLTISDDGVGNSTVARS